MEIVDSTLIDYDRLTRALGTHRTRLCDIKDLRSFGPENTPAQSVCSSCQLPGSTATRLHPKKPDANERICQACDEELRTCGECLKPKKRVPAYLHPTDSEKGHICSSCYNDLTKPKGICANNCSTRAKNLPKPHPVDKAMGRVCANCHKKLTKKKKPCPVCNNVRYLEYKNRRRPLNELVCLACHIEQKEGNNLCSNCGESKQLSHKHPTDDSKGKVCSACNQTLKMKGHCPRCKEDDRVLRYHHPFGLFDGKICGRCRHQVSKIVQIIEEIVDGLIILDKL